MFTAIRRTKAKQLEGLSNYSNAHKVAYNTIERTAADGTRIVRLHLTDIVAISPDGTVTLSSGGFKSKTTKDRMSSYLPSGWCLYSDKGIWYLSKGYNGGPRFVFCDGITIEADGTTVSGAKPDEEKRIKALNKRIGKYCQDMAKLESLPLPSSGDCWYCLLENKDGKSMGELSKDISHLENHLEEGYHIGSLILCAMRETGCTDMIIHAAFYDSWLSKSARIQAVRSVRRYLRAKLGLSK